MRIIESDDKYCPSCARILLGVQVWTVHEGQFFCGNIFKVETRFGEPSLVTIYDMSVPLIEWDSEGINDSLVVKKLETKVFKHRSELIEYLINQSDERYSSDSIKGESKQ